MHTCEECEHVMARDEEATLCEFDHEWKGKVLCLDCMSKVISEEVAS